MFFKQKFPICILFAHVRECDCRPCFQFHSSDKVSAPLHSISMIQEFAHYRERKTEIIQLLGREREARDDKISAESFKNANIFRGSLYSFLKKCFSRRNAVELSDNIIFLWNSINYISWHE